MLDPTKRKAYYATFQKIVTDELPIYFINVIPYHTAASKKVGNVPTTIWGPMSPNDEVFLQLSAASALAGDSHEAARTP